MGSRGGMKLTYEQAVELFRYDEKRGLLLWYCRRAGVRPGMAAGFMLNGCKYVTVDGERVMVKKVVWLLTRGEWPNGRVYHLDGNAENCKNENLTDSRAKNGQRKGEVRIIPGPGGFRLVYAGKTVSTDPDIEKTLAAARALLVY